MDGVTCMDPVRNEKVHEGWNGKGVGKQSGQEIAMLIKHMERMNKQKIKMFIRFIVIAE